MAHTEPSDEKRFNTEEHLTKAQKKSERSNWWNLPLVAALALTVAFLFFSGLHGMALVCVWILALAIIMIAKSGFITLITFVLAIIVTMLYIFFAFQSF